MNVPRVEVVCEGEPREMGLAQGTGLRDKIVGGREVLRRLEPFRLRQPWWLPYPLFRRLSERRAMRALAGPLRNHAPEMAERLEGMAQGARVGLGTLYLLNAMEAVMSSVENSTAVPPMGGCSALAVRGRRSATGEPVIARNFDYLPLIQPLYVVRQSRPRGRLRSVDFTVAPLCGSVDGVNERGLCITFDYAFTTDGAVAAPPISMAIAGALGCCTTVAEAAERIASHPRWGGGLLMLADAAGDMASLELSTTRSHLRRPEAGEDVLFHANDFTCGAMREVEVPRAAVFTARAPAPLVGCRLHESSEVRKARLAALLDDAAPLAPDDLAALMADHGPAGEPDDNTLCRHGAYWSTTACLQLFPRSRRMRVAYEAPCRATYREIEL